MHWLKRLEDHVPGCVLTPCCGCRGSGLTRAFQHSESRKPANPGDTQSFHGDYYRLALGFVKPRSKKLLKPNKTGTES